jgi:glutathione-regulated potassium-efflux system protein KefB
MAAASDMGFLVDASIYLAASIISVTLFTRLRLGALLGYLAAGVLIGPHMLGLISDAQSVFHTAEFGVVLLLFIIGLELKPAKLWALRQAIFGLGVAQLLLTGLVLAALVGVVLDLRWEAAIIVGFALALSSTAFAMQLMKENGTLNSPRGETAFGILLLQDLAIVPLLALVALLGGSQKMAPSSTLWLEAASVVGAVVAVVVAGRYLLNPLFRLIAATGAREVLAGAALLVVVGTAAIFTNLGLSMALGAFLAGVALADSEFRHQLEADIEPFRGLLMGLFFVAVGMSLDFTVIKAAWLLVLGLTAGVLLVKAGLLYLLVRSFKGTQHDARAIAATLLQGGEFGFVLFGAAVVAGLLLEQTSSVLQSSRSRWRSRLLAHVWRVASSSTMHNKERAAMG